MTDKKLSSINVDEGFLPKFNKSFLDYYGEDSLYVRTVSDYFTMALARMLEAKGMLMSWDSVALFSSEKAVDILSEYFKQVDGAKEKALSEAFGNLPLGSTEELINDVLGTGTFSSLCRDLKSI